MTWAEWRFTAHLAWQDGFIRWVTVLALLATIVTSSFVLWRLIPEGVRSGSLIMHYNIYLGIDDVRAWPSIFLVPGGLAAVMLANTALSFGIYRSDALAARTLTGLAAAVVLIAGISSFFLVLINV